MLAEELTSAGLYPEGGVKSIVINAYERSAAARKKCIEVHGTTCAVCGFDFEAAYGLSLAGFIHVHHTVALSRASGPYRVDPTSDLIPVCPNCHAVLHRKDPPFTIQEVRNMLLTAKPTGKIEDLQ